MQGVSMFRKTILFLFSILLISGLRTYAQERPKVGLVLSGGGAKGFAHVGALRVMEEYNIPIDYIGGTSIGAIIGGLYAVGYNAQEMEEIILAQDWESLFADEPERIYLPFYEKEEQDRYQISMAFKEGKIIIPNYAITNNGIRRFFTDLTIGYHDVEDFNELPTPFLCVAVNLENGEEVVLDSGSLPTAMIASMAIPGVFPSVDTDSSVFVDGGVRNNFPVDHVRAMGADIIIGIDVGAGMRKGEDLKSFGGIVDQLTTMLGAEKFQKNREDVDLYIKPDISNYTTADFTNEAAIGLLAEGKKAARANAQALEQLAEQFKDYDIAPQRGYTAIDSVQNIVVKHFDIQGTPTDDDNVLGMMGISEEEGLQCNVEEMKVGLDRLKSSMNYSKIDYRLKKDSGEYTLHLDLEESSNNSINFGAHYNSQEKVALLLNGTFNTLLLRNSRISADIKLSEAPAVNLKYNINRGSLPGLGLKYGYRRRSIDNYEDGTVMGDASVSKHFLELNTNSVINDYFTVGLGARYENYSVDDVVGSFMTDPGQYNYILYRFFFEADTKDKSYYPTRGLQYYAYTDLITDNGYELNDQMPSIVTYLGMNNSFSFNRIYTLTTSLHTQLEFVNDNTTPVFYNTYVGGYKQYHNMVSQIPFWGLKWGEYRAQNVLTLGFENRFQVAKKNYVYLNANVMAHTEVLNKYSLDNLEYKWGMALGYSYDSFLGPIEVFFSFSNSHILRTHINIGYYF